MAINFESYEIKEESLPEMNLLNFKSQNPFLFNKSKTCWLLFVTGVVCFFVFFSGQLLAQTNDSIYVKDILISGNTLTRPHVIFREITIKKGTNISKSSLREQINQSEKFLFNTHLFLEDTISDTIRDGELYVYIKVKERYYIEYWHAQAKAADRDVNVWIRKPSLYRLTFGWLPLIGNLTGENDRLTVSAVFGWRQTYQLDYRFPYINKAKTLGLENIVYYQRGHEIGAFTENNQLIYLRVDQNFMYHKTGWESDLIYRKKYQVSHTFTLGFDYYDIADTVNKINPDYFGNGRTAIRVPRLAYKFIFDKRDYTSYAKKGDLLNFSIEHDGLPFLLKDVNITTTDLSYRKFIPLGGRVYYQGGFISEYNFQNILPYVFRNATALGYRYDVDGFENYVIDGRAYFITDNEFKFLAFSRLIKLPAIRIFKFDLLKENGSFDPLPLDIYLKIFTQQGSVFYNGPELYPNSLTNKLLNGFGAGLDLVTYYDAVMRIEYSFNNLGNGGLFFHFTEVF